MFVNYNVFAIIGSYIRSQYLDDNDYEGIKDSGEIKSSDDNYDDVENPDSEEQTFEKENKDGEIGNENFENSKFSEVFHQEKAACYIYIGNGHF